DRHGGAPQRQLLPDLSSLGRPLAGRVVLSAVRGVPEAQAQVRPARAFSKRLVEALREAVRKGLSAPTALASHRRIARERPTGGRTRRRRLPGPRLDRSRAARESRIAREQLLARAVPARP